MRRPIAAAAVGALAGVIVAGSVKLAYAYLDLTYLGLTGLRTMSIPPSPIDVLLTTAGAAGPGAFILAFALSIPLRKRMERGASRGRVLALGTLGGLPAGMLNLLSLMILLGGGGEIPRLLANTHGRMIAVAALAGGAALGLGCAWWLTRPLKESA